MLKPFIPHNLPLGNVNWTDLIRLIGSANASIARYDGLLEGIPNPEILLSPLMTQEAVLSSKIEGTIATLEEVLEFEADPDPKRDKYIDIEEIINYRKAMREAKQELEKRPLCLNLIKTMHQTLLKGVRGQNKMRGEFRNSQNWIGKPNTPIKQASYIPPSTTQMMVSLSNWEEYCHFDDKDTLVQLSIMHAQFEMIHPFLDGNGRIGRIFIPLYLYTKKVLNSPMFYISAYFESNRDEYYSRLLAISEEEDWIGWITFFLQAIIEQAKNNSRKTKEIMKTYNEMKTDISNLTSSRHSIQTLDFLFSNPIFNTSRFALNSKIPKPSAARIINILSGPIIKQIRPGAGRKPALYLFPRLLDIIRF